MNLSYKEKLNAFLNKDASYEGTFITAVKTTGIFCRPGCTARQPKPENIEFFDTPKEAMQAGYRPCKVCKPMTAINETPENIKMLLDRIYSDPSEKIKDYDLVKMGLEPAQIRRWFNKNHNMTFQTYQRMVRLNLAFQSLLEGETVTNAAFDHGFESLSGFNSSYRQIFKENPGKHKKQNVIQITRFSSPLGPMYACASQKGLCLLEFTDRRMLETEFHDLRKRLDAEILPGKNPHLEQIQVELQEYFEGKRKSFDVPLDAPGTDFQRQVWRILQDIPYATTRSYKQQAEYLGNPKAIRAVASANGHNRIAIVIPCHRVIGSDGNLTGYGGGLARKQWLLEHELKYA